MHTDENLGEEGAILQIFAQIPGGGGGGRGGFNTFWAKSQGVHNFGFYCIFM
jgi:hypothetical protein